MNQRTRLLPVTMADKNGKYSTVYRRVDESGAPVSVFSVPARTGGQSKIRLAPSVTDRFDEYTTVTQNRNTLKNLFIPQSASDDERAYRTDRIKGMDPITLAVVASAVREHLLDYERLTMIDSMTNDEAREYGTIMSTLSDIELNATITYALFNGIRPVSDDGETYEGMDLGTDLKIAAYSNTLRLGMQFVAFNVHGGEPSAVDFDEVFTMRTTENRTGQVLNSDLRELAIRRPRDINAICDLMRLHPIKHAAAIEDMLDHGVSPISEGVL